LRHSSARGCGGGFETSELAIVAPGGQQADRDVMLSRDNLDENGSDNQSLKWRPVAKS
jgi:hypothetical protein